MVKWSKKHILFLVKHFLNKNGLKISFVLIFLIFLSLFIDYNKKEPTEDQFISRYFRCPEYLSEEEKDDEIGAFIFFYIQRHPTSTEEEIFNKRYEFLVKNNCTETVKIWDQNQKEKEDLLYELNRSESMYEVLKGVDSGVIKK